MNIAKEFDNRFKDFDKLSNDIDSFQNPFGTIAENFDIKYKLELLKLKSESKYEGLNALDLYKILPQQDYPNLHEFGLKMLSMFGSTYMCESSFSHMKIIKSKERTSLSDKLLKEFLRINITNFEIIFQELV